MKRMMYVCAILAVGFINVTLAQDINGKWKGQMQGPDGAMDLSFNFKVVGDSLTGNVASPMGELPISNGKINGKTFSFDVNAGDFTINHQCTVMSDSISMKTPGMQGGESTAIILKRAVDSNKESK
jgi:hypothetical protein